MNLIDRDELLRTVERDADVNVTGRKNAEEVKRVLQTIYDDIKDSPVQMRWIPVNEALPTEDGTYMVCTDRGGVILTHWYNSGHFSSTRINDHIVAWMPLPEPYEVEEWHSDKGNFTVPKGTFDKIYEDGEVPTVDAVPVRHGKWIDEGQYADFFPHHAWRCSECGKYVIEIDVPWYKFCPECGARMDEERKEEHETE